ncbi:MAG: sulfatase-like hydrolase/transferase [Candidatus Latescibacteria bacterium]|nr:sulfatase-like hydrolase/transferase [Candidatus Latescibacterota bacterium]
MSNRPNILWYCSDQQRFDTLAALGNPHINTPRLDQFMERATAFTHAYCQSPICTPSRASFLTGMYPSAIAVNGNGYSHFPDQCADRLLPHILNRAGYDCGLVGKLHLASPAQGQEPRVDDGYRYFQYSHDHKGPRVNGHDYADWIRAQGGDADALLKPYATSVEAYRLGAQRANFGGLAEPSAQQDNIPPHLHQTHWCSEKAIDFIAQDRPADQPWMLSVNPFDPHPPFDAPWEYYRRYDAQSLPGAHYESTDLDHQQRLVTAGVDFQSQPRHPDDWDHRRLQASYYAMIEQVDHEFGRLLDALKASDQLDNTVIIFTSDHGEMLADHGLILKGCRFYEGLVRVPLLISWPGHFAQGQTSDALVELIDLAPTLYEAAGVDTPYWVQGQSLAPVLTATQQDHRPFVRTEFYGAINYPDQTHATMYRDRRWKLVSYHGKDLYELYDLENDPWEHRDLSQDQGHQDILRDLIRRSFDAVVYAHAPQSGRTQPF